MKTILIPILILFVVFTQNTKQIDTENSIITFTFTDKDVDGSIGDIQFQSTLNWKEPEKSILKGSVAVTTLKTGNFLRDGHLMWEKYFNRSDYPRIYFESKTIEEKSAGSYTITGNLTIKGIKKEVQLTADKRLTSLSLKETFTPAILILPFQRNERKISWILRCGW